MKDIYFTIELKKFKFEFNVFEIIVIEEYIKLNKFFYHLLYIKFLVYYI